MLIARSRLTSCLLIVLGLSLLAACSKEEIPDPVPDSPAIPRERAAIDSLDRATAVVRKAAVSEVEYDVTIDISQARDTDQFSGEVTIRFNFSQPDTASGLTVDFGGGEVQKVSLNGSDEAVSYNSYFISLPATDLVNGPNTATIRFTHPYSQDGTGLHRFTDPVDGLSYLYTYLWPYYANRLFPVFDQPNLKARFTLSVRAPDGWIAVSTSSGVADTPAGDGTTTWQFGTTPLMASYAFSLHAGPYTVWQADADGIPMRLMARQSLAEFVAVEEWFDITRRGLSYYGDYFDIPYPFEKYDQLIVPDFNIGAMENIAAVTFGEFYVQRQASDRTQREMRAGTILHEMAHMWFGDLVTHDWWNGMWLNESFATQMAAMAQLETSEFTDTWHGFFTDDKQAAYRADSRVTTHPVEGPVNSTIDFFEVFDAITYQKGASTLKQLAHYVGEENYRRGVSSYLKANAYGNTELDDFVSFQSQASGKDITAWANEWLYQPGFNTLEAQSECVDGELTGLRIMQTAPEAYSTLRHHQVDLALYPMNEAGALEAATVLPVTVMGPETVIELPAGGLPCPALMNPNHNDWTLAQIKLGERDLETLETHLADVPEPLARSMFLAALYQRAMEGRTPLASYLERASALAEHEDNVRIQQQISASLIATVELMQRLRPETDAALATWLPILEEQSLRQAATAPASDFKRIGINTFLGVVATEAGMVTVRELLDGTRTIPGLPVTSDLRWLLLIKLAGHGQLDTDALLSAEAAVDDSDYGVKSHLTALAARPDLAQKRRWLAELQNPEGLTGMSRQRAVMGGLFPASQTLLQEEALDEVLQALPVLSHKVDPYFMTSYVRQLLQPMCLPQSAERMRVALEETADQLDSTALRFLREAHQADSECLILREEQVQ